MITENVDKNYGDHDIMLGRNRLEQFFKDMRELWEQIKQPCSFRTGFILFSLSIFAVFQSSSATVVGLYNDDLIMISNCSAPPLTHCPRARKLIAFREQCINGFERAVCMAGSTYLCGIVDGYIIETCAVDMECWPGTFFSFVIINGTVTVECVRCLDGTFETEHTKTSHSSHVLGCSYRHIPQDDISLNLVLYENGTHATPSIYRCKTEEGFFNEYGNKFCDDIQTHRCKCIFKYCEPGYQLHPNGYCMRCRKKLRPEKDWRCEDYVSYQTRSTENYFNGKSTISGVLSSDGSTRSSRLRSIATNKTQDVITVTDPSRDISPSSTDSVKTDSDKSFLTTGVSLGLGLAVLVILFLLALHLFLKCRSKRVRDKQCLLPTVTYNDKSVTTIEVTHVCSNKGNMLIGERSKMINTESPPVKEDIDETPETLPNCLKLKKLESMPFLQNGDHEDNDMEQTEKKTVIQ